MKAMPRSMLRSATFFAGGIFLGVQVSVFLPSWFASNELSRQALQNSASIVDILQDELQQCRSQKSNSSYFTKKTVTDPDVKNGLCKQMTSSLGVPSAASLWNNLRNHIVSASHLSEDKGFTQRDFTVELLNLISPKLPNSVKSVTRNWNTVHRISSKLYERYSHVAHNGPKVDPVRIVVMGGSVTKGTNCRSIVRSIRRDDCAWPNRLEQLLNANGELVEVTVVGMGGTNSATGAVIQELDLLPESAQNPDIVINNYSTNDMHLLTQKQAAASNTTLREQVFEMAQDFVRSVLSRKDCGKDPLLLWFDDYLGNEQPGILATTDLAQGIHVLSSYYGFASASYADLVRDRVYGDSKESLFSAQWFKDNGEFVREIHPSSGAHISMAWTVAYNLVNLAATYCAIAPTLGLSEPTKSRLVGRPGSLPNGLPPRLEGNLTLQHVSRLWEESNAVFQPADSCEQRCIFSWISGIDQKQDDPEWIEGHIGPYLSADSNWKVTKGHPKVGFAPADDVIGSTLGLEFRDVVRPVRSVTIMNMKSYGKKWRESQAIVTLRQRNSNSDNWSLVARKQLSGYHDKETSETFSTLISLDQQVEKGANLMVEVTLAGGSTFKLMGISVCG